MKSPGETVLLSTAYCAPVPYFAALIFFPVLCFDRHEHYTKQTYRNRCTILGANGPLNLVIPVEHGNSLKIMDIRIAWHAGWQRSHWRTLFSAYNNSPFFPHYADEILPFYQKKWTFLFDFNLEYFTKILSLMEEQKEVILTDKYEISPSGMTDKRKLVWAKTAVQLLIPDYSPQPYTQVFNEKFPFVPNLSILDLLFNIGPAASLFLKSQCGEYV